MKRVVYSNITKTIAFIICVSAFCLSIYKVGTSFIKDGMVYLFEESYLDSHELAISLEGEFNLLVGDLYTDTDPGLLLDDSDWEYYINKEGKIYTNVQNASYEDFAKSDASIGIKHINGEIESFTNSAGYAINYGIYDENSDYAVCLRMSEDSLRRNTANWNVLMDNALKSINLILILIAVSIAAFVFMIFLAGRKCEDKEIHLMTIDRMYVELNLILTAGILAGTAAGMFIVGELIYMRNMTYIISAAVLVGAVGLSAVITLVMSVVRNLKNKTFLKCSLTAQIIAFLWKLCKRFIRYIIKTLKKIKRHLSNLKKKIEVYSGRNFSGKNVAILFIGYSIILSLFAAFAMVPFALATIVVAVIVLLKRIEGFNKIKFGIEKIKNGDLAYKIEGCPDGVMGCMAEDINSIGEGLKESVESEIKSERMKSELITNVSHDLKTPLTSIINYSDLLNKMNLTPNEANDYVKIINQKANRLKNLTSDLFDISKVQSGNETVVLERLDITLLINQTLGELDANIKTSELEFKTSMPDESYIMGDGKKLSRVFENLIGNTLKYSLKNTRVYISVNTIDEETIIEIKNISSYPMEFDSEEITERFVRGDESRTTEGSGLGLAIAKSYTEACGGEFKIVVDGDLFKAILKFKTA